MASFFKVLDEINRHDIDCAPILFQAGAAVPEDWHRHGGFAGISGAADFLRMQRGSGGYAMVNRGDPAVIGGVDLIELDEVAGRAVLVCITPYPKEFERGLFYGGVLLAGDMEYVEAESVEEPHSQHLTKKTVTLRFRKKAEAATRQSLDALLVDLASGKPLAAPVPPALFEALAWRLQGVEAQARLERSFHQQSSLLLSSAANEVHELSQKLGSLAYHDELTGLLNRRAVLERAKLLLVLGGRMTHPTAFVMIDVDHFKSINDRWGHAVGDEILRLVATLLRGHLRDSDLLGRIGGEEFLAVLPDTDVAGALFLAESLRRAVECEGQLPTLPTDGERIPVTISLGVAVAEGQPGKDVEMGDCIKQADEALYRSKRNGRNQVTWFMGCAN